jgi:hypothetical protein
VIYYNEISVLQPSLPVIPMAGEAQIRIYNMLNCPTHIQITGRVFDESFDIPKLDYYYNQFLKANGTQYFDLIVTPFAECANSSIPLKIFSCLVYEEKKVQKFVMFVLFYVVFYVMSRERKNSFYTFVNLETIQLFS